MSTEIRGPTGEKPISPEVLERLKPVIPPAGNWTPVDIALYGVRDLYHVEKGKAEQLRWEAIRYAFNHHYEHNEFYRRYCQADGIRPEDIKEPGDLLKIPLIPDTFFKDYPQGDGFARWLGNIYTGKLPSIQVKKNASFQTVLEALYECGVTVTFTSGTSGRFSFYPRNQLTWMRQLYSFACCFMDILGKTFDPQRMLMQFAPNPNKTFLFISRATSAGHLALVDPENLYYIINHKITPDTIRMSKGMTHGLKEKMMAQVGKYVQARIINQFVKQLEMLAAEKRHLVLGGAPSLIQMVVDILAKKGIRLDLGRDTFIVTGGGWKMAAGAPMTDKQFREQLFKTWGVPEENCRDIYGMSECSSLFPSCEGHYKHIPHSILYPMVLGEDSQPLGYGQYGRLAFLDPMTDSYPGFMITGDRVKMLESCPVCDRIGPVIASSVHRMKGS
jgi:long-chain-fatty-acid---luciferin-component ligase